MRILSSMQVGVLTVVAANLALVAGFWWMSRGKGIGRGLRRAAAFLLALLGVAGGAVTYRAEHLRQDAAERRNADLTRDAAGLKRELTNALAISRVQEAKLATLERTATEQRQMDAERAAALEADLKKAMEDIGAMFNERNGVIELVLKDALVHFDTDKSTLQCDSKERLPGRRRDLAGARRRRLDHDRGPHGPSRYARPQQDAVEAARRRRAAVPGRLGYPPQDDARRRKIVSPAVRLRFRAVDACDQESQ